MKKSAFTLSEALITLGIIGVVASLTIPVLVGNYKSKVSVIQLKKMYSVMSQALMFTVQKDGDYNSLTIIDNSDESIQYWYKTALKPYIKVTNECFNKAGCWASTGTKTLNGNSPNWDNGAKGLGTNIVTFTTVDGYTVCVDGFNSNQAGFWGVNNLIGNTNGYVVIYVDVNGQKGPNVIGKDTFIFIFSERGFVPAGHDLTDAQINANCKKSGSGYYCFEKIMRNGWNIDKENLW